MADAQEQVLDIIEEWPPDVGLPTTPEPPAILQKPLSGWPDGAEMPATVAAVVTREHIVEQASWRLEQWVDLTRRDRVPATGEMLDVLHLSTAVGLERE